MTQRTQKNSEIEIKSRCCSMWIAQAALFS
mgnify:CR=1 FL=1